VQTIAIIIINVKVWCIILYTHDLLAGLFVRFCVFPPEVSFGFPFRRRVRACVFVKHIAGQSAFRVQKIFPFNCGITCNSVIKNHFHTHRPRFFPRHLLICAGIISFWCRYSSEPAVFRRRSLIYYGCLSFTRIITGCFVNRYKIYLVCLAVSRSSMRLRNKIYRVLLITYCTTKR